MPTIEALATAARESMRPPAKLTLSEWADRYAVLSAESSAEAGRWHTLPYQKGIMDAITDPDIERVTVMKSARVGYSKVLNHVIGYHIHQDPCPIMLVQPTIEDAEGYSKEEITPMLRDTPVLRGLVADPKAKDGSATILNKMFKSGSGSLSLVGANSPRGFRRVSRRVVLFDEVDGYPQSAGPEGDQIKLGIRRTEYYWNRKIVAGSTPTTKELSRIERMFRDSDQRRYFVPCPDCGHMQYLKWSNIRWQDGDPETAAYCCESCGVLIPHSQKRWMVERGEWRATAPMKGRHAGFHIWAAYSYSPNASWPHLVAEFLESKTNPEALKTFVNTVLGECWEEEYSAKLSAEGLLARVETYAPGCLPSGAVVVTAGIDVQDNRVAISLVGWGPGEEGWVLDHMEIYGDPGRPQLWTQVDAVISRPIPRDGGEPVLPRVVAIDSGGHYTHEVYAFARDRRNRGVIAIKGQSQRNKAAIGKPSRVDFNWRGRTVKRGAEVYPVGSDTIKTTLYSRLRIEEQGPGFLHFHADLTGNYFEQLTAEVKQTTYRHGFPVSQWVLKPGMRNEALDCLVYSYSALQLLYIRYPRASFWEQVGKPATVTPVRMSPATVTASISGGGFVSGW